MLILLSFYLVVGLLLAGTWTGTAAIRHIRGLAAFLVVTLAWPVIVLGLIVAVRNY
jgi:hypothetical protein